VYFGRLKGGFSSFWRAIEGKSEERANVTALLKRLHQRRRRRVLRRVARLLAELDFAAEQVRPRRAAVSRMSVGTTR
jgi:hypothetical protein